MPTIELLNSKQLKHAIWLIKKRRFREIYNYAWVRTLWWSPFWQRILLVKLWPITKHFFSQSPPFLEVEPTTRCNIQCAICENTYWNEPGYDMSFEKFKSIVDQFPRLKWIGMTGIGSSYLNKDFINEVEYIKSKGTIVELIDSFNHIDETMLRRIVDMGVDIQWVSIYAGTKETYEKACKGANFDKILNNIKYLIKYKKERRSEIPVLNLHYIVSNINKHETELWLNKVAEMDPKRDSIYEVLFTPLLAPFKEVKQYATTFTKEEKEQLINKGRELNIKVWFNDVINDAKQPVKGCAMWIMPFIFATGHVMSCCLINEGNRREFEKATALGNVYEQSWKEIWNGEYFTSLRNMLRKNQIPVFCQGCPGFDTTKSITLRNEELPQEQLRLLQRAQELAPEQVTIEDSYHLPQDTHITKKINKDKR